MCGNLYNLIIIIKTNHCDATEIIVNVKKHNNTRFDTLIN